MSARKRRERADCQGQRVRVIETHSPEPILAREHIYLAVDEADKPLAAVNDYFIDTDDDNLARTFTDAVLPYYAKAGLLP